MRDRAWPRRDNCGGNATIMANFWRAELCDPSCGKFLLRRVWPITITFDARTVFAIPAAPGGHCISNSLEPVAEWLKQNGTPDPFLRRALSSTRSPWTSAADTQFHSGWFFEPVAGGMLARGNNSKLLSWDGGKPMTADDCADRTGSLYMKGDGVSRQSPAASTSLSRTSAVPSSRVRAMMSLSNIIIVGSFASVVQPVVSA